MKILHVVENYYPSVGGMQEVVRQLSERMAAVGHDVTVVCGVHPERNSSQYNGVKVESFAIRGSLVQGISGEKERYETYLLQSNFDIVVFFAAQIWSTDIALPLLDKIHGKKVFVPTGFSALTQPAYSHYYEQMKQWMKAFDMNVFLSNDYRDIQFARDNGITQSLVIPNAADEREFEQLDKGKFRAAFHIAKDQILLLHVGSFTGLKGHLEALQILNSLKAKNVTLCFIGNDFEHFPKYKRTKIRWWLERMKLLFSPKRLLILPPNRQRTLEAFADADVFLFPSNIECSPLVLFEAVASETPFLSNDVGNAKEIAEWTKGGLIMPTSIDANGFSHADIHKGAEMLDHLITDAELRNKLSTTGKKLWREQYTWQKICDNYLSLYHQLHEQK